MKWRELGKRNFIEELRSKDPYEILGVSKDESLEATKVAYIKLVKIYHPDVADKFMKKTNEEILKIINRAYDIIKEEKNAG